MRDESLHVYMRWWWWLGLGRREEGGRALVACVCVCVVCVYRDGRGPPCLHNTLMPPQTWTFRGERHTYIDNTPVLVYIEPTTTHEHIYRLSIVCLRIVSLLIYTPF